MRLRTALALTALLAACADDKGGSGDDAAGVDSGGDNGDDEDDDAGTNPNDLPGTAECDGSSEATPVSLLTDDGLTEDGYQAPGDAVSMVGASNGTTTAIDFTVSAENGDRPPSIVLLSPGGYTENQNAIGDNARRSDTEGVSRADGLNESGPRPNPRCSARGRVSPHGRPGSERSGRSPPR